MFDQLSFIEMLKLFAPVILVQLSLDIYCIVKIIKDGVRNLNKFVWVIIVLGVSLFGAIAYLLFGRRRLEDDTNS